MDAITELQLTQAQLMQLIACHMYLQVTMLAEITDHTGAVLLPLAITTNKEDQPIGLTTISHSLLDWPTTHLSLQTMLEVVDMHYMHAFYRCRKWYLPMPSTWPMEKQFQLVRYWKWCISPLGSLLNRPTEDSPMQVAIMLTSN